jgi:DNA-binding Lrp family transcriptional regulator
MNMRAADPVYSFGKIEVKLLRELANGRQSLSGIRKSLSLKPALLSYNVNKLDKKGLIQTKVSGNSKLVGYSETKHAVLLRDLLLSYDFMDWDNILSGKSIEILFQVLDDGDLSRFSSATLWRYLKELKARGIIADTPKGYQINSQFKILEDFLREYERYFVTKISKTLSESSVILWQKDMEFLVRVPNSAKAPTDDFKKTATSVFSIYDLPLFSDYDVYYYSTTKQVIKAEDAVLHTLLIEPGNRRYSTYALLLLKKTEKQIDKTYLVKEAQRLGLESQIEGMLQFLQTHIRPEGLPLPSWADFAEKARDYGVII